MITGRIYTLDGRKIIDSYLGNEVGRPIAMMGFDTLAVNFLDNRFVLIATKGDDKSMLQSDRLYIESNPDFQGLVEFADICNTPKVKERIRVLALKIEEDARYGHIRR